MASPEKSVLARILFSDEWGAVVDRRVTAELFSDDQCRRCFRYIAGFYGQYAKIPSLELVEEQFPEIDLKYAKEPVEFYIDKMTENFVRNKGSELLMSKAKLLVESPMLGLEQLQAGIANLAIDAVPTKDDFIGATAGSRRERYLRLKQVGGMDGYPTPWTVLNTATMGLHAGDFVTIVSRPGIGKTFMLTIFAEFAYRNKLKVLFVTNEMSNTQIMQRFDAVHFRLPYQELRAGLLPDALEAAYFEGLNKMGELNNLVVTQDVQGIMSVASKVDQYAPDLLLVDGMYLLSDDSRGSDRHDRITNISQGLKKMARKKKIPIVATTQFNRAADEVRVDKVTLSNLGFSDSIGQDADVVLGLFRNKDMEMNNEMKVRMLKVREGEPKDFMLKWDLHRMAFDLIETSDDNAVLPEDVGDETIDY